MSQARFQFGPITQDNGWELTYAHGEEPSRIVVSLLTDQLESLDSPIQSLTISQDDEGGFTLSDCHITQSRSGSGVRLTKCTILDRRWRWQYAHIDGEYNKKNPDGTYEREKTPRELAALLFDSMGELNYSVDALPEDEARPYVNWQAAGSADELASLCSKFGCLPSLDYLSDRAGIHAIGEGDPLPTGGRVINQSQVLSARPLPASLRVRGGPVLFETRLRLGEALCELPDGELVPMEEADYLTELGDDGAPNWQREAPGYFGGVEGTYLKEGKTLLTRELAAKTCYKIYRITGQSHADPESDTEVDLWSPKALNPDGEEPSEYAPYEIDGVLPLRSTVLSTHTDPEGRKVENPAAVYGTFQRTGFDYYENDDGDKYPKGFSIDAERGIVRFNEPVYIIDETDPDDPLFKPAELELQTSYPCSKDGVFVRYEEFVNNSDPSAFGSFYLERPELQVRIAETTPVSDNTPEVAAVSQQYLNDLERRFEVRAGQDVRYSRLVPLSLSGIVRQITWSGGGGQPAATRVSLNMDHNPYVPDYEKRQERKAKEVEVKEKAVEAVAAVAKALKAIP